MLLERPHCPRQLLLATEVALGVADTRGRKAEVRTLRALGAEHPVGQQRGVLPENRLLEPGELYLGLLDAAGNWLPAMLDAAIEGPHPVLVHCAAGKDRTGVAVALLLRLAGVTRAAVDADFTRTNARRIGLQRRLERRGALRPGDWNRFIEGLGFGPDQQVQA